MMEISATSGEEKRGGTLLLAVLKNTLGHSVLPLDGSTAETPAVGHTIKCLVPGSFCSDGRSSLTETFVHTILVAICGFNHSWLWFRFKPRSSELEQLHLTCFWPNLIFTAPCWIGGIVQLSFHFYQVHSSLCFRSTCCSM